ncbi:hypothetical protein PTSG_10690 [Salpingoeca rosetta]|uniref:Uncharacterized protein n=1 Tax=Salpingoeca rosetta (strain ATCC 50818 / BSB-021) TaxID=946362 RepID=F2UQ37_SALR5|nr:uncharacterized protein PTSG_10690 [Salpingoeca rosetta]EGD79705.1 hypothetical protein PTSG_10690 [Salpingoeca rosetta]|eukprot:XP_004988655.1 hypothetical protein PTSG_10690 [Salpingoeca rosetta]
MTGGTAGTRSVLVCLVVVLALSSVGAQEQEQQQLWQEQQQYGSDVYGHEIDAAAGLDDVEFDPEAFAVEYLRFTPSKVKLHPPDGGIIIITLGLVVGAGLSDDPTQLYPPQAMMTTATGKPLMAFITPETRVSGNEQYGHYRIEVPVPLWNVGDGDYKLEFVYVVDKQGRDGYFMADDLAAYGMETTVTVTGARADSSPPLLLGLSARQEDVCTRDVELRRDELTQEAPCPVSVTLVVRETGGSGLSSRVYGGLYELSRVTLASTHAPAIQTVSEYVLPASIDVEATKAMELQGAIVVTVHVHMPFWVWPGGWEVREVLLVDGAGNSNLWERTELAAMKTFTTLFTVHNANLTYVGEDLFDYLDERIAFDEYGEYDDGYW